MNTDQVNALKAGDYLYRGVGSRVFVFKISWVTGKMIYSEFACEANGYRSKILKSSIAEKYSLSRTEAAERQLEFLNVLAERLQGQVDAHKADSMLLYEKLKEGEL